MYRRTRRKQLTAMQCLHLEDICSHWLSLAEGVPIVLCSLTSVYLLYIFIRYVQIKKKKKKKEEEEEEDAKNICESIPAFSGGPISFGAVRLNTITAWVAWRRSPTASAIPPGVALQETKKSSDPSVCSEARDSRCTILTGCFWGQNAKYFPKLVHNN